MNEKTHNHTSYYEYVIDNKIEFVGYDCWGTLVNPKKEAWEQYAGMVQNLLSKQNIHLTAESITTISKNINNKIDLQSAIQYKNYTQEYRIKCFLECLDIKNHNQEIINEIKTILDTITSNPKNFTLIDETILLKLKKLKQIGKYPFIISNTGLISGKQTDSILNNLGIMQYFYYRYYSDELDLIKPDPQFFNKVRKNILKKSNKNAQTNFSYIGDNYFLDYLAPKKTGFKSAYFTNDTNITVSGKKASCDFYVKDNKLQIHKLYQPISPSDYSKMKYGCKKTMHQFANIIFEILILSHREQLLDDDTHLIEAYKIVPSANIYLTRLTKHKINNFRKFYGKDPIKTMYIRRTVDNLGTYSHIKLENRNLDMFDELVVEGDYSKNILPLLIDDIIVSGAYTQAIHKVLLNNGYKKLYTVYVAAACSGDTINNQTIERILNHSFIDSLNDTNKIFDKSDILPTRKYIKLLRSSSRLELVSHFKKLKSKNLKTISDLLDELEGIDMDVIRKAIHEIKR